MAVLLKIAVGIYAFKCPGCDQLHQYWTNEHKVADSNGVYIPQWDFNGDMEHPTFTPSLLNRWGKEADPNWEEPKEPSVVEGYKWSGRCHLFVTAGQIQYCGDCTHELAGKTVPMVELPEEMVQRYK